MRKISAYLFLILIFSCATNSFVDKNISRHPNSTAEEDLLKSTIDHGIANLKADQISDREGKYWRYPARLGLHFTSQYFIMLKWLGITYSQIDLDILESKIIDEQLEDGSWYQIKDGTHIVGNLDASIFNYWALKVISASKTHQDPKIKTVLDKAKKYILSQGGLENAVIFTKVILALHGNISWKEIPYIPLTTVKTSLGQKMVLEQFAQWVIPHLKPMAYMRYHQIVKRVGDEYQLLELYKKAPKGEVVRPKKINATPSKVDLLFSRSIIENTLLREQHPRGSWGAYTLATLFSVVSIDHYQRFSKNLSSTTLQNIDVAKKHGIDFIEKLYFNSGESSYYGVLDDSTYWDSGLALWALAENEIKDSSFHEAAQFLIYQQQNNGGFPFGYDFWNYPDIDDTFVIVMGLQVSKKYDKPVERGLDFVLKRQNKDGGWGTFDVDNVGNSMVKLGASKVADSADLFDESEPDITGHSLELMGRLQGAKADPVMVKRAYEFLKKTRHERLGVWHSRWEMNYLFGTFAVVGGLVSVGYDKTDPLVSGALKWLKTVQNEDGGFGESARSYIDEKWAGRGISTASQTAWALATFVDAGEIDSPEAQKAVNYLIDEIEREGKWQDNSAVGTGHPGILYMEYPSYPMTFPLIALGKYAAEKCKRGDYSGQLCARFKNY